MKGILRKDGQDWKVYPFPKNVGVIDNESLNGYLIDPILLKHYFLDDDYDGEEVEFDTIQHVKMLEGDSMSVNVYARLIKYVMEAPDYTMRWCVKDNQVPDVGNMVDDEDDGLTDDEILIRELGARKEKLEILAKCLAKTWFYSDWKWENPNERVMQMIMQELGLYPFKDEDEMIQQTQVDDKLYKQATKEVSTYGKLSDDIVESKLDLSEMENKLDSQLAQETPSSLIEWMESKRDDALKKAELVFPYDIHRTDVATDECRKIFVLGWNKAKETLYTKQDLINLVEQLKDYTRESNNILGHDEREASEFVDIFIQSLKQK
jgi:hypothetical protein